MKGGEKSPVRMGSAKLVLRLDYLILLLFSSSSACNCRPEEACRGEVGKHALANSICVGRGWIGFCLFLFFFPLLPPLGGESLVPLPPAELL